MGSISLQEERHRQESWPWHLQLSVDDWIISTNLLGYMYPSLLWARTPPQGVDDQTVGESRQVFMLILDLVLSQG